MGRDPEKCLGSQCEEPTMFIIKSQEEILEVHLRNDWSLVVELLWYWKAGKEINSSPEIFESWTNCSMTLFEMLETALEIWNKSLKKKCVEDWDLYQIPHVSCVSVLNYQTVNGHGPWLWRVTAQLEKKTPWHFSQLAMSGSNLQPIWPDLAPWWPSSNSDYPQTIAPVGVLSKLLKLQRVGHKFPTYEGELAMLIPTNTTSSKAIKTRPYGFMVTTHWWRQKPTLRACPPSGVRTSPSARSKWHSSTCLTHMKCQRAQQMLTRQSLNNQNYKGLLAITLLLPYVLGSPLKEAGSKHMYMGFALATCQNDCDTLNNAMNKTLKVDGCWNLNYLYSLKCSHTKV